MNTPKIIFGMQYLATPERDALAQRVIETIPPWVQRFIHASPPTQRETCGIWSMRLWTETLALADAEGGTHCLFTNEDVDILDGFWEQVPRMIAARPTDIISLQTPHWKFEDAYVDGADWAVSYEGLVGVGYILPRETLRALLKFRAEDMKPAANDFHSEDGLINTFAMAQRRPILHPLPSPMDHVMQKSFYGHDGNVYYHPVVMAGPACPWPMSWDTPPVHIGMVYCGEHWRLRSYLKPEAVKKYRVIEYMYELERTALNPRVRPR